MKEGGQVGAGAQDCYLFNQAFRARFGGMPGQGEPPEIKEGDTVVLDILGSEAIGQYGLWLSGIGFLSSGLGFISDGIKSELATIEQGEAEGRSADDVRFWLASAARLNRLSLMVDETDCIPPDLTERRCFISKLVESGYLALLRSLRSCCNEGEPISGHLDSAKEYLQAAAEQVAGIAEHLDSLILQNELDYRNEILDRVEWFPITEEALYDSTLDQWNTEDILTALAFCLSTLGMNPATIEVGYCGKVLRYFRGVMMQSTSSC